MFTQKCFINQCNNEIICMLFNLGYTNAESTLDSDAIVMTIPWNATFVTFDKEAHSEIKKAYRDIIDCGTNEELFLAIAALRDDSDIDNNQVFIHQDGNFYKCECDSKIDMWGDFEESESYPRKATVSELIELFKK